MDLLYFTLMESPKSRPTRKDYGDAIKRLPVLYDRNRLEDIPLDLVGFKSRFDRKAFDPAHFKSENAYLAWRRKVIAAMKEFLGVGRAPVFEDGWTDLQRRVDVVVRVHPDFHPNSALVLSGLVALARNKDIQPHTLSREMICQELPELHCQKAHSVRKACAFLDRLHDEATDLHDLLPAKKIGPLDTVRRSKLPPPPAVLMAQVDAWISDYCDGVIDEITGDVEGGSSLSTRYGYRAAFTKYLGYAQKSETLDGITALSAALSDSIALPVMREMITCSDPTLRLSERAQCQYLENIVRLAKNQGIVTPAISKALTTNRSLKSGKKQRRVMSPEAKKFCQWILASRRNEMLYRSLHIRFYNRAVELQETLRHTHVPRGHETMRQLGVLAAMSAIWAWAAPLRIENMCALSLYGPAPQVFLPKGKKTKIRIHISAEDTKNNRIINQSMSDEKHRGVEVVNWYVSTVRPTIPGAENSPFLFPTSGGSGKAISKNVARTWLSRHIGQEGLAMKPHWFRHAAASLYIRKFPGAYDHVAQLLDDTPEVVRRYYSWIDDEAVLTKVQQNILEISGFNDEGA